MRFKLLSTREAIFDKMSNVNGLLETVKEKEEPEGSTSSHESFREEDFKLKK